MLILNRNEGEVVEIWTPGITIRVIHLGRSHGADRWGIEAPKEFRIDRGEIAQRIRAGVPPPNPKKSSVGREP